MNGWSNFFGTVDRRKRETREDATHEEPFEEIGSGCCLKAEND